MTEKKTAEEVREILTRLVLADDLSTTWKIKCHKSTTKIMEIMEAYAAQKIADKMVEERLKNAPKNCPKAAQCAHVEGGMKCPPNVICPI